MTRPPPALRVAAAQAATVPGDIAANLATAAGLVHRAAARGARLVLLPEAFPTGYDEAAFAGPLPSDDDLDGGWLDPLRAASAATGIAVVLSTPLRRGSARTMSMLVVPPGGPVTAPYDKQHLDADETPYFAHGAAGASITVGGVELALSICYDASFPEHARDAADGGAIAYLNSAAFFAGGAHRRDLALAARALDNGMYVVVAAATGRCDARELIGGSAIYDPDGRPLARLEDEEGLAVADLDPAVVAEVRSRRRMHADRRPGLGARVRARGGDDLAPGG